MKTRIALAAALAAAGLTTAAPAQAQTTSTIDITTTKAQLIAETFRWDTGGKKVIYRPRIAVEALVTCPAGQGGAIDYRPRVYGNDLGVYLFTCTGTRQTVVFRVAATTGTSNVAVKLLVGSADAGYHEVASDSQLIKVVNKM
jgi:hypothetical protein